MQTNNNVLIQSDEDEQAMMIGNESNHPIVWTREAIEKALRSAEEPFIITPRMRQALQLYAHYVKNSNGNNGDISLLMKLHFEPLTEVHDVSAFSCRAAFLDDYLRSHALEDIRKDIARTLVCVDLEGDPKTVVGFFTLQTMLGQYIPAFADYPEDYIYPIELAYLARNARFLRQGIGEVLMVRMFQQVLAASEYVGFPGVALTATNEGRVLYEKFGFIRLFSDRSTMYLPLSRIRAIINALSLP